MKLLFILILLLASGQKHYQVSGRQLAVNHAGLTNMLAYQEVKATREIKTDFELALHRGSAVTGTTNVAPQFSGFMNRLTTNYTTVSGVTLTEKMFNDICSLAYANPVNLREGYMNIGLKRTINQFTTSVQRYIPASDRKSFDIIDVYEAEMGVIALFKSRYQFGTDTTFANGGSSFMVIDPDYFQVGWLRPLTVQQLAVDGDRERRFMVAELTLIARSEKAGVGGKGFATFIR